MKKNNTYTPIFVFKVIRMCESLETRTEKLLKGDMHANKKKKKKTINWKGKWWKKRIWTKWWKKSEKWFAVVFVIFVADFIYSSYVLSIVLIQIAICRSNSWSWIRRWWGSSLLQRKKCCHLCMQSVYWYGNAFLCTPPNWYGSRERENGRYRASV